MKSEVELVLWPGGEERRRALLAAGRPHLLLVHSGSPPPVCLDVLEDWIRAPAPESDLEVRAETLRRRARDRERSVASLPALEENGMLRFGDGWVALSPLEARIVGAMITRLGAVVTRQGLTEAGWPRAEGGRPDPHRNTLDAHILRLRQRLPAIGLTIRTIRSRGYLLEPVPPTQM